MWKTAVARLRQGLAQRLATRTFGQLAQDWLSRISRRRVCPENERRHVRHLSALAHLREGELTKAVIEEVLGALELGPATLNKVRGTGRLIIRDAQGNGRWRGLNPFELVARLRQCRPTWQTLSRDEAVRVLRVLTVEQRRLVKLMLLAGPRPGEALGLHKLDVDLEGRMLRIRRSHGRAQTKTGREREFPIHAELLEDLRAAMAASSSELVFPRRDGRRQRADTKLTRMLRVALLAAGIVTGWRYRCLKRRCAFAGELYRKELEALPCPECGELMWRRGIPRALRFYDLRHSSATLYRKAGTDALVIREMLGHASRNQTDATYTHLDADYQRAELSRLTLT